MWELLSNLLHIFFDSYSGQKSRFYVLFIFKLPFNFSLSNMVKDMWSKFLSIKGFPALKMWSKSEVNFTM